MNRNSQALFIMQLTGRSPQPANHGAKRINVPNVALKALFASCYTTHYSSYIRGAPERTSMTDGMAQCHFPI